MKIMDRLKNTIEILKENNQEHIINLLEKLDGDAKEELINKINELDFEKMMHLYNATEKEVEYKEKNIEPIKALDKSRISKKQEDELNEIGEKILINGQYAVVTMAGGQGTRLGHPGPKGTFKLDIYGKGKYLFEILAENLKEANELYNTVIPWYIMTSRENNQETQKFLKKNNFFGYPKDKVTFFTQSELPVMSFEGKLLIDENYKIKEASDGNGGTYSSLRSSGILAQMKEDGIKWVFIGSVDNVLLKMVDTLLLGFASNKKVQIASKTVIKASPEERVGVFCKMNGAPKVIEYTELSNEMAKEIDEDGDLKYGEAHIMCNLYTLDAIEKISKENLEYHIAKKKNAYRDENGSLIKPEEENSYKFESFIFDAFEFFDDIALLRGTREDDFAPVKNAEGVDSPKTAKELYEKYWERQIEK